MSNEGPWPTHVDVGADVEWEDTLQAGRVIGLLEAGAYADAGFFALLGTIHDAFAQELLWAYLKAGGSAHSRKTAHRSLHFCGATGSGAATGRR